MFVAIVVFACDFELDMVVGKVVFACDFELDMVVGKGALIALFS